MKYLFAAGLGIVVGAAAALALLYFNPLTGRGMSVLPNETIVLEYALPHGDALVSTHGGMSSLPREPTEVPELWEGPISKIGLSVLSLKGDDGAPVALASRVRVPSPEIDLLFGGAVVSDYWLVTLPGEGSFFVQADNNLWPFIRDVLLPVRYFGRPMPAEASYAPTVGPEPEDAGAVFGATGRFAGLRGAARASYRIDDFDREEGLKSALGRLHLNFDVLAAPSESVDQAGLQ